MILSGDLFAWGTVIGTLRARNLYSPSLARDSSHGCWLGWLDRSAIRSGGGRDVHGSL